MKNRLSIMILVFGFFLLSGCDAFGNKSIPYVASGEMVIEESSDYDFAGLNLVFMNKSDSKVKSFTIVFFLFDEDGNSPSIGKNNLVLTINTEVKSHDSLECCLSLDSYLFEVPEIPYEIDYLYVSKIVYEDDSVWSDPFGTKVFY